MSEFLSMGLGFAVGMLIFGYCESYRAATRLLGRD